MPVRRAPHRTSHELLPAAALHGPLDETDRLIVATLRRDPQASNKSIAREAGVSEPTIAARIRSLTARNLIHMTAQRDIFALGLTLVAHADVHVAGPDVGRVADDLARLEDVSSVAILEGAPQIIAQIHARDAAHLLDIVENGIGAVAGVEHVETNVALEILKYRPDAAVLTAP